MEIVQPKKINKGRYCLFETGAIWEVIANFSLFDTFQYFLIE